MNTTGFTKLELLHEWLNKKLPNRLPMKEYTFYTFVGKGYAAPSVNVVTVIEGRTKIEAYKVTLEIFDKSWFTNPIFTEYPNLKHKYVEIEPDFDPVERKKEIDELLDILK